jgi:hypothetical protein
MLTQGGTERALAAADAFIRLAAGSQGIGDLGTMLKVAIGEETIDQAQPTVRIRWWAAGPGSPLFVHLHDIDALRAHFADWVAGIIPADERTAEPARVVTQVPPRYRANGESKCREHLAALMRGGKPGKGRSKVELRAELTREFRISSKAFDRAWASALDAGAHDTWGRAGRRKKSSA